MAAHQIALQVWLFLSFVLDSFAVAAQPMVGTDLGVPVGAHDQDATAPNPSPQMKEQTDGGDVGPLEIVQEDQ